MSARLLMVQGTSSSVGKSLLVAGLCRLLRQEGYRVAPFKAQNMSNNAAVTPDGGEIGRAQAVQARAAGLAPAVEMNPVLLKPEADHRSQIIVRGRHWDTLPAREYFQRKRELWEVVVACLAALRARYEVVVIEGAGSPAEVNLRATDIANMAVALHASAPVLLVGDIDRGGVFAQIVGTLELLAPEERALVRGLVINKFRGDLALLGDGLEFLARRTGVPVLGVVPYLSDLRIAEEDAVALEQPRVGRERRTGASAALDVAVARLPRIANFDDLDPLAAEPAVALRYVERGDELGRPDLVVIPGSKSTLSDLAFLRASGLADAILAHAARGGAVLGLCGGYQMLGEEIVDSEGIEGPPAATSGLGLLPVRTAFAPAKLTHQVRARVVASHGLLAGAQGAEIEGYEIHVGRSEPSPPRKAPVEPCAIPPRWGRGGEDASSSPLSPGGRGAGGEGATPLLRFVARSGQPADEVDGAVSADGRVVGTYLHGLLHNPPIRRALIEALARRRGLALASSASLDEDAELDRLAAALRQALDLEMLRRVVGL